MLLHSGLTWWRARARWERAILVGTAIAVAVAAWSLVSTLRSRARVHQAAIASLTNYAAVGMEQFVNGYEGLLRQSFVPILPPSDEMARLPPADMIGRMSRLQEDPCRCQIAPGPVAVFRLDLDSGDAAVVDSLGRPLPGLDSTVAAAVRRQSDSLSRAGWGYAFQVITAGGGAGPQFLFFSDRIDSATHRRYAYGFTVPAAHMGDRVFQPAFQSVRLIPRHLLGTVSGNGEFLSFTVETREGRVLYSTAPAYPDGPSNALQLPTLRGGMVVRAHLNPRIKDALIPGGIPPRVPLREIGLTGLSLALLIAIAVLALRVGAVARLRSDLASSVTHELKTPLTQIRLAAETVLLGRSRSAEAERRSLASIVDEAKRLEQLIENVLHFSRAERRMTRVQVSPVELRPVVERAAGDLAPLVADRGIVLRVEVPDHLVVRGDANALRQITLNLLDNAARYGPDGQAILIGAHARDGQVDLWVEDRGPGIPPAERSRVWQAFVRLERDRESAVTGTGLGLAVVHELVEAQGGRCWIEGDAGHGARVVVRLAREAMP